MKPRQYKKLCKKAAELIGLHKCGVEDGIFYTSWCCNEYDGEWDGEDAWPYLIASFDGDVNITLDDSKECGVSWVDDQLWVKATPKNVFKWARSNMDNL
jgi:hypothetical protein